LQGGTNTHRCHQIGIDEVTKHLHLAPLSLDRMSVELFFGNAVVSGPKVFDGVKVRFDRLHGDLLKVRPPNESGPGIISSEL
jgi:hypothetical protein